MTSTKITKQYLIITNISKRPNVRALLKTALAFRCEKVLMVGQPKFDTSLQSKDLPSVVKEAITAGSFVIQRFSSWDALIEFLVEHNIRLVGVEIHKDAKPIEVFLDGLDTAFLMGNEGQGLNQKQMNACDAFVMIPQYGSGTASLNVYVAASIILQRFHQWQRGDLAD